MVHFYLFGSVQKSNRGQIHSHFLPAVLLNTLGLGDGCLFKAELIVMQVLGLVDELNSDFVPVGLRVLLDGKVKVPNVYFSFGY